MTPFEIIDTPVNVTRYLPRLDSISTIIRYITRGNPTGSKHVKLQEVKAIKAAGKKLALVHETYGDFAHAGRGGISAVDGQRDGIYSRAVAPKLGAPAGAAVYFAVDVDASPAQIKNNVLPYFKNVAAAFADGEYRVGVYGCGAVCKAVTEAGYAELGWLSNARGWTGFDAYKPHAALVQRVPIKIAGGLDIDPNDAQVDDWGQFEPFADDAAMADDPQFAADADVTAAVTPRLGAGEDVAEASDSTSTVIQTVTSVASLGGGMGAFHKVKSIFRSKIAWLTGGLGGTGVATSISSDPQAASMTEQLLRRPSVWLGLGCIILAGLLIYFYWKDHGKGSVQ